MNSVSVFTPDMVTALGIKDLKEPGCCQSHVLSRGFIDRGFMRVSNYYSNRKKNGCNRLR